MEIMTIYICILWRMDKKKQVTRFEVPGISNVEVISMPIDGSKWSWKGACDRCKVEVGGCLQYMPDGQLGFHCCHKHLDFDSGNCKCPHTHGHETVEAYVEDAKNCIPGTLFPWDDEYLPLANAVVGPKVSE